MDFITVLKEKVFKRYSLGITKDEKTHHYKLVNYSHEDLYEQFFSDLTKDLSLPIADKKLKFTFSRQEFKGFKNSSLQSFIKQNPTMEEFDNVFHSFYKNIDLSDLFNAAYIKTDYNGRAVKSVYEPFVLYFLKQDFTHQNLYPNDFLSVLRFNFPINEKNYPELKENLYSFLKQHVHVVKEHLYSANSANSEYREKHLKDFESTLYEHIGKFIKPHDMKLFNDFWPHILIKKTDKNMITKVDNTFTFDLNFAYLSDTFTNITNEKIAQETCEFINRVINENLSDYLSSSIIKQTPEFSRFIIEFHSNLKNNNIPDIFEHIIELKIKSQQFKNGYLKSEYKDIWDEGINLIKKAVYVFSLSNKLEEYSPQKNSPEKKLKI